MFPENQRVSFSHPLKTSNSIPSDFGAKFPTLGAALSERIEIEPISLGKLGQRYRVHYAGAIVIASSRNPEFDALFARGITGRPGGLAQWRQLRVHAPRYREGRRVDCRGRGPEAPARPAGSRDPTVPRGCGFPVGPQP